MYLNIHSGSSAPAEHDLPSLATIFSQALSPGNRYWILVYDDVCLGEGFFDRHLHFGGDRMALR